MSRSCLLVTLVTVCFLLGCPSRSSAQTLGLFQSAVDIGDVGRTGNAVYDADADTYTVSGGGENMWFAKDELHYVWKQVRGDVSLAADVRWPQAGGDAHRKACLIIRQSLDPDSAYADAVVHGDGLCSIQYRETAGDATHEIQSNVTAPQRIKIEKRGSYVSMKVGDEADGMMPAGGTFRIEFDEPFYVGLGVCADNDERLETAVFSQVVIERDLPSRTTGAVESTLETISIASTDRRVVYHTRDRIEAPNWLADGETLLFNGAGWLSSISRDGGTPTKIITGDLTRLNTDHGISPDGRTIVFSDQTRTGGSRMYVMPLSGGEPKLITDAAPTYWHGWSPDGKTLAYCAERSGEFDIYTIPVEGGKETRLTSATGLDDGPDYSPDGRWIYFNSDRTGTMQIWRMRTDGSGQTQVTTDPYNDWFPHPSPDGKWIVFLSYEKDVKGHPANQDVRLRMMPADGGEIRTLAKLYGGQGTINVPSWSPDSRNVAFVSYQPVFE